MDSDTNIIKFSVRDIVSNCKTEDPFTTLRETDDLYYYKDGKYLRGGESIVKAFVERFTDGRTTTTIVNEVIGHIKRSTYCDLNNFDTDPEELNLRNGILNLRTKEFRLHDFLNFSLSQIPIKYNSKAKAKRFSTFIYEILPNRYYRELVLDFMASCLWKSNKIKKIMLFVGDTDTGKSILLELITRFLSPENVSNVPLQKLGDRFSAAQLLGKRANIHADIPKEALRDTGAIKTITGGDRITAQRKHGQLFEFPPYARHCYSCNQIPETYDESDALYNRFMIIHFQKRFYETNTYNALIEEGKKPEAIGVKDPNLIDKITTEEELSGILNILLKRAGKIIQKGTISNAPDDRQTREIWQNNANDKIRFLNGTIHLLATGRIEKADLYQRYTQFCTNKKITPQSHTQFNKSVEMFGAIGYETSLIVEGKKQSVKAWRGISYRNSLSEKSGVSGVLDNTVNTPIFSNKLPHRKSKIKANLTENTLRLFRDWLEVQNQETNDKPNIENDLVKQKESPYSKIETWTCQGCNAGPYTKDAKVVKEHKKDCQEYKDWREAQREEEPKTREGGDNQPAGPKDARYSSQSSYSSPNGQPIPQWRIGIKCQEDNEGPYNSQKGWENHWIEKHNANGFWEDS